MKYNNYKVYMKALERLVEDTHLTYRERRDDASLLYELVDREKPMKVTEKWSDDCPKCGEFMIDTCEYALHNIPFIKYCPHCGQKLDWEVYKNGSH